MVCRNQIPYVQMSDAPLTVDSTTGFSPYPSIRVLIELLTLAESAPRDPIATQLQHRCLNGLYFQVSDKTLDPTIELARKFGRTTLQQRILEPVKARLQEQANMCSHQAPAEPAAQP